MSISAMADPPEYRLPIMRVSPEDTPMIRDSFVPPLVDKKRNLLDSHVRILQGQFDRLQKEYFTVMQEQAKQVEVVNRVSTKVTKLEGRVDGHDGRIDALERARQELASELQILKQTVQECKSELGTSRIKWPSPTAPPPIPVRSLRRLQKYPSPRIE